MSTMSELKGQISTNDEIINKIITFIYDNGCGYTLPFPFLFKRKHITKGTTLEGDLKITGDDSDEFLKAFSKEFNVNISSFKIGDYFKGERDMVLNTITSLFKVKKKKKH